MKNESENVVMITLTNPGHIIFNQTWIEYLKLKIMASNRMMKQTKYNVTCSFTWLLKTLHGTEWQQNEITKGTHIDSGFHKFKIDYVYKESLWSDKEMSTRNNQT